MNQSAVSTIKEIVSSTEDYRANAAGAINNTGVQSLGNPCTVGAWYLSSAVIAAVGGYVAGGEVAGAVNEGLAPYWPQILRTVYQQALRGAPFYNTLVKRGGQAIDLAQSGCNALQ